MNSFSHQNANVLLDQDTKKQGTQIYDCILSDISFSLLDKNLITIFWRDQLFFDIMILRKKNDKKL
jgi:hypothetical protein